MDLMLAGATLHVGDVDRSLAFYRQLTRPPSVNMISLVQDGGRRPCELDITVAQKTRSAMAIDHDWR
jgi:hypothetical protein